MKTIFRFLALLIVTLSAWPVHALGAAQETEPVIYFFWGDGCPHCATAKPALRALAERLNVELREYEVWYSPENQKLFFEMAAALGFQPQAVPTIIIGKQYWEGYAKSIEPQMEAAIADCRKNGCPDPSLGLIPAPASTATQPTQTEPAPASTDTPETQSAPTETVPTTAPQPTDPLPLDFQPLQPEGMRDNGFAVAIITMIVMAAALVYTLVAFVQGKSFPLPGWADWLIPVIIAFGIGVAGYLSYVETQEVSAVCGPVGDCNAVQNSPYATLFGILPVGVLGLLGYLGLLAAWLAQKYIPRLQKTAAMAFLYMALFAVVFSLYLTYLEPFVIKAVCMWCITSAWLVTILLLLGLPPATRLFSALEDETE
jgi:uncharacterized membrane protein/thiol-disulfide isomerase/thioredoxin